MSSTPDVNPYQAPAADLGGARAAAAGAALAGCTPGMVEQLHGTRPWVRFFAVLGFASGGVMALGAIGVATAGFLAPDPSSASPVVAIGVGGLYFALAVVYVIVSYRLNAYAAAIVKVDHGGGAAAVEEAIARQRAFWKLTGVLTIASLVLGGLVGIGWAVLGATNALGGP